MAEQQRHTERDTHREKEAQRESHTAQCPQQANWVQLGDADRQLRRLAALVGAVPFINRLTLTYNRQVLYGCAALVVAGAKHLLPAARQARHLLKVVRQLSHLARGLVAAGTNVKDLPSEESGRADPQQQHMSTAQSARSRPPSRERLPA